MKSKYKITIISSLVILVIMAISLFFFRKRIDFDLNNIDETKIIYYVSLDTEAEGYIIEEVNEIDNKEFMDDIEYIINRVRKNPNPQDEIDSDAVGHYSYTLKSGLYTLELSFKALNADCSDNVLYIRYKEPSNDVATVYVYEDNFVDHIYNLREYFIDNNLK